MAYAPDPEAVRPTSPEAQEYDRHVCALSASGPELDHAFSYGPDRGQRLEVYRPAGAEFAPVLVFLHGGAWIDGHLGWLRFMAEPVTAHGIVFIAVTYRLAPRCKWPAQFEDVRAALAVVHDRCSDFGGDPARIAIGGHSAGGHLAALLAVCEPQSPILACLPISSSFDLRYGNVPADSGAGRVYRYLFGERSQDADASPIAFVRSGTPRFHIMWGERDLERVAMSGARMVEALGKAGGEITHAVEPGADHFATHTALADRTHPWFDHLRHAVAGRERSMTP
jgi:acetyl esterase/lipase